MNKMAITKEFKIRKMNPEKLVLAVKKHPCIWNYSCPEYRQKKLKHEAWNAIAAEIVDDWNEFTRSEKFCALRLLLRRWSNIRDYYNKSLKAKYRAKLKGKPYDRVYMLEDALQFIRPELEKNLYLLEGEVSLSEEFKSESEGEETQKEEAGEIEEEYVTFIDTYEPSFEKSDESLKFDESKKDVLQFAEVVTEGPKQEDDPDLMFLKSLLPDMKKLADDEKFAFKYAIMQAYMTILKKRN